MLIGKWNKSGSPSNCPASPRSSAKTYLLPVVPLHLQNQALNGRLEIGRHALFLDKSGLGLPQGLDIEGSNPRNNDRCLPKYVEVTTVFCHLRHNRNLGINRCQGDLAKARIGQEQREARNERASDVIKPNAGA